MENHPPTSTPPQRGPQSSIESGLADLDAAERGFVLGALLAASSEPSGPGDEAGGQGEGAGARAGARATATATAGTAQTLPQLAARLAGHSAGRCGAALLEIDGLARGERLRLMAELGREALSPLPAGLESVCLDLCEEILARESGLVISLVCRQGPPVLQQAAARLLRAGDAGLGVRTGTAAAVAAGVAPGPGPAITAAAGEGLPKVASDRVAELQRAVFAAVVAVPPLGTGAIPTRIGRRLANLSASDLLVEISAMGATVLGTSLQGAHEETLARATAHLDAALAELVIRAAHSSPHPTVEEDTARRAALALLGRVRAPSSHGPAASARQILERLGARALGERMAREDPELVITVAQRLRPDLRRELLPLGDSVMHAGSVAGEVPGGHHRSPRG